MKGFLITLISVSFIFILVSFSTALTAHSMSLERALAAPLPVIYASVLFDDAAYELNQVAGPEISFSKGNGTRSITVTDTIPEANISAAVASYESFLTGPMSNKTHATITANFSNLTNDTVLMRIGGGYVYTNNMTSRKMTFTKPASTGVQSYVIDVTVIETRENVSGLVFNASGDMNVTIRYTDLNGTDTEEGALFASEANTFRVYYKDGGMLQVDLGNVGGNSGSLSMSTQNVDADVVWTATYTDPGEEYGHGYSYDALLSYSQGRVGMSRVVGR